MVRWLDCWGRTVGAFLQWSRQVPVPFITVIVFGLFAYACAVLLTLTFHRPVVALLAAVAIVTMTVVFPLLWVELFAPTSGLSAGDPTYEVFPGSTLPLALLAGGCLLAARRMSTDRAVLTGSTGYRQTYFSAFFSVAMGVAVLVAWAEIVWAGWEISSPF